MRACAALVVALTGCFSPSPATGIACGAGDACPLPLVCSPRTQTCERVAEGVIDAPGDDGPRPIDAAIDAAVDAPLQIDGPTACVGTHDEDGDTVVDTCDNCPTVANLAQRDLTEGLMPDGVGDACDPHPTAKDRIAAFYSFATTPPNWDFDSGVSVVNDQLKILGVNPYVLGDTISEMSSRGVLVTRYQVDAVRNGSFHSVEVVATRSGTGTTMGYRCMTVSNPNGPTNRATYLQSFVNPYDLAGGTIGVANIAPGLVGTLSLDFGGATLSCTSTNPTDTAQVASPEVRTGTYGLSTQNVDARFDYLILYEPVP